MNKNSVNYMIQIPAKVRNRLSKEIPAFRKLLKKLKDKDVNEADTVTVVSDMLEKVFGFDRYSEITREYAIRGTYCDVAIKIAGKIEYLIEVKSAGIAGIKLKYAHIRQAVNYGAHEGIPWVVLTNGIDWILYKVSLKGKIESEEVIRFNLIDLNHRNTQDLEKVFVLCKKGVSKKLMEEMYQYKRIVNSSVLVDVLFSEETLRSIRTQLKKIGKGAKADDEELTRMLKNEVIKRELINVRESKDYKSVVKKKKRADKKK